VLFISPDKKDGKASIHSTSATIVEEERLLRDDRSLLNDCQETDEVRQTRPAPPRSAKNKRNLRNLYKQETSAPTFLHWFPASHQDAKIAPTTFLSRRDILLSQIHNRAFFFRITGSIIQTKPSRRTLCKMGLSESREEVSGKRGIDSAPALKMKLFPLLMTLGRDEMKKILSYQATHLQLFSFSH
jgi:hypothetical protein